MILHIQQVHANSAQIVQNSESEAWIFLYLTLWYSDILHGKEDFIQIQMFNKPGV